MDSDTAALEFGLDTFGEITDGADGRPDPAWAVIRNIVEDAVLAEKLGLDFIGIGEHHRPDFAVSAPDMILASIAARTDRIRLGTAVTILSSDDPVRVYERFATLDALSGGRAEVVVGRGAFKESFPLFGLDLAAYEILFQEKLDILARLRDGNPVTWSGTIRSPLEEQTVYPPLQNGSLPVWVGVGGTPASFVRAAENGFPVMLAVIGGDPLRFADLISTFRSTAAEAGTPDLPVGLHVPGYIAETDEQAIDELWPHYELLADTVGLEQGWIVFDRAGFEAACGPDGHQLIGSPESVAPKIARAISGLGITRFALKYGNGTQPHNQAVNCIRLYATEVMPRVRELLTDSTR
jgi:probable LLM family oxidoreductase